MNIPKLGMVFLQDLHWIVIVVALALMPVAATIMPGIFTNLDTESLDKWRMLEPTSVLHKVT